MSIKNIKRSLFAIMALMCFAGTSAQVAFEKGKLYHIYANGNKDNVVYEMKDKAVGVWTDECGICHERKPCTNLHHDWKKEGGAE
jgi:hypothetical protein